MPACLIPSYSNKSRVKSSMIVRTLEYSIYLNSRVGVASFVGRPLRNSKLVQRVAYSNLLLYVDRKALYEWES